MVSSTVATVANVLSLFRLVHCKIFEQYNLHLIDAADLKGKSLWTYDVEKEEPVP